MSLQNIRVLVVDDSAFSAQLLKSLLHAIGVETVTICGRAADGLALLAKRPDQVDLAIIDWLMPEMSGLDMLKAIRAADSPRRELPVVMISGEPLRERVKAARNAGAHDFLIKPLSAQRLKNAVYNALDDTRPFIVSETYVGPCRRLHEADDYSGTERRGPLAVTMDAGAAMRDARRD